VKKGIDSRRVYLGMKLITGINQGMVFSDLIQDKKIYNFGIRTIGAVTTIFGEEDSPQKIQFVLDGGTLKKREMAAYLEHLDILDEPTKGTIISDRMVEFATSSPLSNVQPSFLKLTITSQEASGNWSIDLVPSEVCKKKDKKRNTVAASEPKWSRKSARFDDSDMQSVLNNSKREAYKNNPDFLDLRMDFVEASEHNDLKEKYDAVVIENKELRNEIHELQKRLKNESYHSVTASDVAEQSTNNQIIQASRFTRKKYNNIYYIGAACRRMSLASACFSVVRQERFRESISIMFRKDIFIRDELSDIFREINQFGQLRPSKSANMYS